MHSMVLPAFGTPTARAVPLHSLRHCCQVWTGDWSDDSTLWTKRMRSKLKFKRQAEDGIFWMSHAHFMANYRSLFVCRLFKTVQEGGSWHRSETAGEWRGRSSGGPPDGRHPNACHNPQFRLQLSRPTKIFLEFAQAERAHARSDLEFIHLFVLDLGGRAIEQTARACVSSQTIVARTGKAFENSRQVRGRGRSRPGAVEHGGAGALVRC